MGNGWPDPIDMNDWMRHQEKRVMAEERRPLIRNAADLMGPGLAPYAVRIDDWNADETAFNGFFYSELLAFNSPNPNAYWMGESVANADGYGYQRVTQYREAAAIFPRVAVRTFSTVPGSLRTFTPWREEPILKIGVNSLVFSATGEATLTHGLGYPPTFVMATHTSGGGNATIRPKVGTITATTVVLIAHRDYATPYVGTISQVMWQVGV